MQAERHVWSIHKQLEATSKVCIQQTFCYPMKPRESVYKTALLKITFTLYKFLFFLATDCFYFVSDSLWSLSLFFSFWLFVKVELRPSKHDWKFFIFLNRKPYNSFQMAKINQTPPT